MPKRKYSSRLPDTNDKNNPFAWKNVIAIVEPSAFPDDADQAAWSLARRHQIPPWEAAERLKGFCHDAKPTRH